jgi:hypothetical protein
VRLGQIHQRSRRGSNAGSPRRREALHGIDLDGPSAREALKLVGTEGDLGGRRRHEDEFDLVATGLHCETRDHVPHSLVAIGDEDDRESRAHAVHCDALRMYSKRWSSYSVTRSAAPPIPLA